MRKEWILIASGVALLAVALAIQAHAQDSRICNERCAYVCDARGWQSDICVDCNAECSQGRAGHDNRWYDKCRQWKGEGDEYLDDAHRRDVCRRNGYGY